MPCTTNPSSKKILKKGLQTDVTVEQMLRHHAGLRDHRHEISVTLPARHDMPVKMIFDACAGAFAEIHAQIDAGRVDRLAHDLNRVAQRFVEIDKFLARQVGESIFMALRSQ